MLKKLLFYGDIFLLARVFRGSLRISLLRSFGREDLLLSPASRDLPPFTGRGDREKIIRYVNLCMFLRRKLGMGNTCFNYSLLLCDILRKYSFDAKVCFGARKQDAEREGTTFLAGHCWVAIGDEELTSSYKTIFQYP